MKSYLSVLFSCFLFSSCQSASSGDETSTDTTVPVVQASAAKGVEKGVVSEKIIGALQLSMPMADVNQHYSTANDFSISINDKEVAAKRITLSNGEYMVVEDGNQDGKIDRISTNGSGFVSKSGYKVGTKIKDILAKGETIEIGDEEGIMVLHLQKEKISVYIDGYSEELFYEKAGKTVADLSPIANITEISIVDK